MSPLLTIASIVILCGLCLYLVAKLVNTSGKESPEDKSFLDNVSSLTRTFDQANVRPLANLLRTVQAGDSAGLKAQATELLSDLKDPSFVLEYLVVPLNRAYLSKLLADDESKAILERSLANAGFKLERLETKAS